MGVAPTSGPINYLFVAALLAGLFASGAAWLWHAQRRGLYAQRGAWTVFVVEVVQVAVILLPAWLGGIAPWCAATGLTLIDAVEARRCAARAWPQKPWTHAGCMLVVAAGFCAYAWLATRPHGFAWVLLAYGVPEVHDATAWLAGGAAGRTPLAPTLSPRKTWEGEAAGTFAGVLFAAAIWKCLPAVRVMPTWAWVPGVLAAGIAGDFASSWVKRRAGQKDFARWIPTQGGALDLYDALLWVAPLMVVFHLLWVQNSTHV